MKYEGKCILFLIILSVTVVSACSSDIIPFPENLPQSQDKKLQPEKETYLDEEISRREELLQEFIHREMTSPYGGIYTNYLKSKTCEYGVQGIEVLSESVGLMMHYAVLEEDKEIFDDQYNFLVSCVMLEDGFIPWKIEGNGTRASCSSASIDDIRIAYYLLRAYQLWGEDKYFSTVSKIVENIMKYEVDAGNLVSYYDKETEEKGKDIKLSYLDIKALQALADCCSSLKRVSQNGLELLLNSRYSDQYPFYKKTYNYEKRRFLKENKINLIDTLLVSLHLSEAGIDQDNMVEWLRKELVSRGKIFGQYYLITGQPAVNYESAAVYALGIRLCLNQNERESASQLMERLFLLQDMREGSPTYGGIVDINNGDGHSFDNLQAIIAMALYNNKD